MNYSKSIISPLICSISVLFILASCKKSNSTNPVITDVYMAGHIPKPAVDGNFPTYWKNGIATALPIPGARTQAASIAISGTDIYVAGNIIDPTGTGHSIPICWKNGVADTLSFPSIYGEIQSIAVTGNDVYAIALDEMFPAGTYYWKNSTVTHLANSRANAIVVSGSDVYIAGDTYDANGAPIPTYWKNGQPVSLPTLYQGKNGHATTIAVSGPDVYVAGSVTDVSGEYVAYWKNGKLVVLTPGHAENMALSGSDVYLASNTYDPNTGWHPLYWKNGKVIDSLAPGYTNGIAIR